MRVGIVGAGNAGKLFLKTLIDIEGEIEVVGITDINPDAPGLILAKKRRIPTYTDMKLFMKNDMDLILELTGNTSVKQEILSLKKDNTHLMDSHAAKLTSLLSQHQQKLYEKLEQYIKYIESLMKSMADNISKINETVETIGITSEKIIDSVNRSTESINETDNIVMIINDITSRIKILGINASIEAARAGEHGAGFSVVAEEIGKLTDSSKSATSDITSLIKKIKQDISGVANITEDLDVIYKKQNERG
jgi:methyl-accepting chemotaxis protein